jgi:hypothetical protein
MSNPEKLIPPAPVVRDSLARNIRERRLLRSLLRLSVRAAEERRQEVAVATRPEADDSGRGTR